MGLQRTDQDKLISLISQNWPEILWQFHDHFGDVGDAAPAAHAGGTSLLNEEINEVFTSLLDAIIGAILKHTHASILCYLLADFVHKVVELTAKLRFLNFFKTWAFYHYVVDNKSYLIYGVHSYQKTSSDSYRLQAVLFYTVTKTKAGPQH